MDRNSFKQAVTESLEKRGCKRIKVGLSIAGLQANVTFKEDGFPFKREAHVQLKEKDGKTVLNFEAKDGQEWEEPVAN